MKILIAIPSKKRADILNKNSLNWVPLLNLDYKIFVEKEDYEDYSKYTNNLICLPYSNKGLGFAKQCIKEYAVKNGYEILVKIDDDVSGWTDFRKKLNFKESAEKFKNILEESINLFNINKDIVGVSFPYSFQMFEKKNFVKDKRIQTVYITKIDWFHCDEKISVFEDFAVGLNAITKGKLIMKYGMSGICLGVMVGKGNGGHQSYDREKQAFSEIIYLRQLYPPLKFRKVNKIWHYEPDLRSIKIGYYK